MITKRISADYPSGEKSSENILKTHLLKVLLKTNVDFYCNSDLVINIFSPSSKFMFIDANKLRKRFIECHDQLLLFGIRILIPIPCEPTMSNPLFFTSLYLNKLLVLTYLLFLYFFNTAKVYCSNLT